MNAAQLKESIDLHDLAARLGLQRQKRGSTYHAPWRPDKKASLSVFEDGRKWKDHGSDKGGSCIDLIMHTRKVTVPEAMRILHEMYGFPFDSQENQQYSDTLDTKANQRWRTAKSHPGIHFAAQYLTESRKLPQEVVNRWQGKVFGFSDWIPNDGNQEAYGPAITFPVFNKDGILMAVNMRYLSDGHEPKMRFIGEASGGFFLPDSTIKNAHVIWLVESPIDALTLVAAGCPAIAFLSASMVKTFPFSWLNDRQRLMILADADEAGQKAAATLYHRAISAAVSAQMVEWPDEHKDPNDALKAGKTLDEIKELASRPDTGLFPAGSPIIPSHEFGRMGSFVCNLDSTEVRQEMEEGPKFEPVASFRVFHLDPIAVHDPTTALSGTGSGYTSHKSLVTYRRSDSAYLHRRIIESEDIGKPATWQKFGHLHSYRQMARLLQILSRDQNHIQESVGVIGLVYVDGKPQIMDARNSYLTDEECVYHRLRIPSAPQETAKGIIEKMDGLLKNHLGVIQLAWFLGILMKIFLEFWPHLVITGHSGSGKTIIATKIIHKLTGCDSKEPSELQTPYRRMKVISNHIYPVIFDEISRAGPKERDAFVDLLNSSYRYQLRHHGQKGMFLVAAPACLVGQDNPITDAAINTKTIQLEIDGMKNESGFFVPDAPFPVREWAQFLVDRWDKPKAETRLKDHIQSLHKHLKRAPSDLNLGRFVENYAALQFALEELFCFSGYENNEIWGTVVNLMNEAVKESAPTRRESVAILERLAEEITLTSRHEDRPPFLEKDGYLAIPPKIVLPYLAKRGHFFPVTSSKRLVEHLNQDGFLLERNRQRTINRTLYKCVILDLKKLREAGVDWPISVESDQQDSADFSDLGNIPL